MTSRQVRLPQARPISVSERVALGLRSPGVIVTWFVTCLPNPPSFQTQVRRSCRTTMRTPLPGPCGRARCQRAAAVRGHWTDCLAGASTFRYVSRYAPVTAYPIRVCAVPVPRTGTRRATAYRFLSVRGGAARKAPAVRSRGLEAGGVGAGQASLSTALARSVAAGAVTCSGGPKATGPGGPPTRWSTAPHVLARSVRAMFGAECPRARASAQTTPGQAAGRAPGQALVVLAGVVVAVDDGLGRDRVPVVARVRAVRPAPETDHPGLGLAVVDVGLGVPRAAGSRR